MPAGGPINPPNRDPCLLTRLLQQEIEGLTDIALIFAAFIPLYVWEVQPPAGFALKNPADVLYSVRSIGKGFVLIAITLHFFQKANDLRSFVGLAFTEPLTSQTRCV